MPWIAEFESPNTRSRAFGETPEEAVRGLLKVWKEKWAPMSGADPDYINECREEVTVSPFEIGAGYLTGTTDDLWHKGSLRGDDARFDACFDEPAPTP